MNQTDQRNNTFQRQAQRWDNLFAFRELRRMRIPRLAIALLSVIFIIAIAVAAYPNAAAEEIRYFYFAAIAFWWTALFLSPLAFGAIFLLTILALVTVGAVAPTLTVTGVLVDPGLFLILMAASIVMGRQFLARDALVEHEEMITSKALLHTITSNLLEVITITDANQRMTWASPSAADILGYAPDDLVNSDQQVELDRFVHPEDRPRLVEAVGKTTSAAQSSRVEWRFKHKQGHYVWLETLTKVDADANGQVKAYVYVSRDITDRKVADQNLIAERNLLRNLIDTVPYYIYVKDTQSRFLLNNRPHMRMFGVDRQEDLLGKTDADFFPAKMAEEYLADETRILQTGEAMVGKIEQTWNTERQLMWGLTTESPLYDIDGKIIGLVGSTLDVSKEIEFREALIASEATKKALLEALPDTIYRFSSSGVILDFNPSHATETPLPEYVIGQHIADVMPPHAVDEHLRIAQVALETREPQVLEYQVSTGDTVQHYEARIIVSGADEVTSVIREVTDQKRAESERLELERVQGALEKEREIADLRKLFTTTLSHEFRTPLATIMASVELLENYGERMTTERRSESLQSIRAQIKYLVNMLNDILTIMQVQGNTLRFNPTPTDVLEFVQPIIKEFQASIGANHVLKLVPAPDVGTVLIDQRLLRYILFNLLSNAIKYSQPGTEVTTTVERTEDALRVRVLDRGIGIPEEDQKKLFEAFHRARNVQSISGSGLGLKIVRDCAELHFGQVQIDSQENVGTRVTLTLPLRPPRDRTRTTTSEVQASSLP